MLRYSAVPIVTLILAPAGALQLNAQQVIKPRTTAAAPYRLPKPASFTAEQQPDGRLRVVWSAVQGAERYKLVRSVPPEPAAAVTLSNAGDTVYVDGDVKAGSTHYYVVSAINADGIEGLKAGASVKARVVAPVEPTTATLAPLAPATNVVVKMYDYLRPVVTWQTSVPGARAIIDRLEIPNGSDIDDATWQPAVTLVDKSWPCSTVCQFVEDPRPLRNSALSQYRVTIVEPAPSTRRAEPVLSNKVFVEVIPTAPTEVHQVWLVKGESHQLRYRPDLAGVQYLSLDSNTVSIWSPGVVKAKEFGITHVFANGRTSDGTLKTWAWQIHVGSGPQ